MRTTSGEKTNKALFAPRLNVLISTSPASARRESPTVIGGAKSSMPLARRPATRDRLVVVIVVVSQAPVAGIDYELAGLAVLRADGLEIVALPRDLDVGVALRVQLLPDLRF